MSKIAILTDSGSALDAEEAKALGIYVIPLQVMIDNKAYEDGVTITTSQLIEQLKNHKLPKTSTPTLASILAMIDKIMADGHDEIIAVPLSRNLSSTQDYLIQAAKEKGIKITMIEVYSTLMLQQVIAKKAKLLVDQGLDAEAIKERLVDVITRSYTLIMPSDLEHLKAGGRLTPAAASLAKLFKIRPILHLGVETEGKVDVFDKVRTDKKAIQLAVKTLKKRFGDKEVAMYVLHCDAPMKASETKDMLIDAGFDANEIIIDDIVAVIASHTGLGCVGIQMIEKA